jgi:methylmalonyl-CoA mutase, C-terminal domain
MMAEGDRATRPEAPIRVLLGKVGLDGHDRGVRVILRALRDAGMEVAYTGLRAAPEEVAREAIEGRFDAVGLSCLSGSHGILFPGVAAALREAGADLEKVVLFCGGTIPSEDREVLARAGFRGIFGPGTPLAEIVAFLVREVRRGR